MTGPLKRVLRVFLADVSAPRYGYDLMKAARLPSGTLYPMLARLQDQGLVAAQWEQQREDAAGRPPRKYYRLTGESADADSRGKAPVRRAYLASRVLRAEVVRTRTSRG